MMDIPEQRLSHRLQWTLLAFFLLATLFLVVVYVVSPSIYTTTLLLAPSPADWYSFLATLFLVGIGMFLALLMIGVLRRWRWMFWLVLVALGAMILDIPVTLLQLTRVLPTRLPGAPCLFKRVSYPCWYCTMPVLD